MAPAPTRSQPRGWLATLVVLVLMVAILALGFYANGLVENTPSHAVTVASGVVITPGGEWEFAGRSDDGQTVLLTQGVGSLAISVVSGTDSLRALEQKRDEWLATEKVTISNIEDAPAVNAGRSGVRFSYSGTFEDVAAPVEGEVTSVAGTSVTVLFDGWAGVGEFRSVESDIEFMIAATVIP